jgi:hypothetical protein
VATADKLTFDIGFVGTDVEQVASTLAGPTNLKAGTRPALVESEAYNSSSDVTRINMSVFSETDEYVTPLFGFVQEMSLTIDNQLSPNKAVGTFGAFDLTAGSFMVSGTLTAYFDSIAAMSDIRNNSDVSIDAHFVKANQGISFDLPLITIGDGRPNVESDAAITLPISFDAATGAKIDPNMDHTMMLMFFDYLPTVAEA